METSKCTVALIVNSVSKFLQAWKTDRALENDN